jgi:ribosome-binding protein aMBF1 (putative translation factor)
MVRPSELKSAAEIHERDLQDEEYRLEVERTQFANDLAIKVIQYRVTHGLSQAELARRLGMDQSDVARLDSGE